MNQVVIFPRYIYSATRPNLIKIITRKNIRQHFRCFFFAGLEVAPVSNGHVEVNDDLMTNNNSLDKVGQSQPNGVHHQNEEPEKVAEEDTGSVKDSVNTGPATNSIVFCFLFVRKSLICLEGKSMTPLWRNTILCSSSQQLPRLCLGPLKGFLS